MKLSSETIGVLKNFSSINSNIVIHPGNELKTISEAKNILATAKVSESFDTSFGIYDLNEFLSVLSMFKEPDVAISEDSSHALIKEGRSSVKYFFSDTSILTSPAKTIQLPSVDVSFKLTQDDMNALRKASSALGVTDVVFAGVAGSSDAIVRVTDERDATANSFELSLTANSNIDEAFKVVFNISNFKFINGEYDVEISNKLISRFCGVNDTIEYFVALEKSSQFGG
jgi:hypothetical protein